MRRPWKRDGPSTSPSRGTTSRTKNRECRDRVRMCARRPRVFGLSDFEYLPKDYRLDNYSNVCCVAAFSLTAHGQRVRADATQTTFAYVATDYRLDKYSNVCCVALFLAYRSRQDGRGGNATQTTFENLATTYCLDKYSNACCLVVFLAHRFLFPHRSFTCLRSVS